MCFLGEIMYGTVAEQIEKLKSLDPAKVITLHWLDAEKVQEVVAMRNGCKITDEVALQVLDALDKGQCNDVGINNDAIADTATIFIISLNHALLCEKNTVI